ncbi:MAG TPA: DUF1080 domain-containing protein [Verrucomicrobiae bacterium]
MPIKRLLALALFCTAFVPAPFALASGLNTLTKEEESSGWKLLFDGKSFNGWRTFKDGGKIGAGWKIEDGLLHKLPNVTSGDIITESAYTDFEFSWEWKLAEKGNNGVKYFIIPERKAAIGHEYQMIDDTTVKDDLSKTASFYLIVAPMPDKPLKPMGEWNQSRIVVKGTHVEHWLNGVKVTEYECGDAKILEQVAKTKFKSALKFGEKVTGHILLTDHKDECWFRNIKLRELK